MLQFSYFRANTLRSKSVARTDTVSIMGPEQISLLSIKVQVLMLWK